jgi:hypothetical protein
MAKKPKPLTAEEHTMAIAIAVAKNNRRRRRLARIAKGKPQ